MKYVIGMWATIIFFAVAPHSPAVGRMSSQGCSTDAAERADDLYRFRTMVASTDLEDSDRRDTYMLQAMDSTHVTAVTVDSVCVKAIKTMNRYNGALDSVSRSIVLIKLGTAYIARDPQRTAGEFSMRYRMNDALDSVLVVVFN